MPRFRFTISGIYYVDLSDDHIVQAYGSTAPSQIAKIDQDQLADNPVEFLAWTDAEAMTCRVEPEAAP
jgi:hypothetical protein